uniref:Coagulation factor IX n=1 Tax=Buteo japonicus TaxID=224669 RepID=A0A8C0HR69_9AVES
LHQAATTGRLPIPAASHGGACSSLAPISFQIAVFIENKEASSVLSRQKRANSNRLEEVIPGNLERECIEEKCSFEEAREVFENTEKTMEFWKTYIDGDQCDPNPCKNGAVCKDAVSSYVCWCPAGYEGRNYFTCAIKNGGCKHFCRHDPPQKVVCSCAAGYRLHEDGNAAPTTKITPIIKTGTRVVGGSDSMRGEVPWQVLALSAALLAGACSAHPFATTRPGWYRIGMELAGHSRRSGHGAQAVFVSAGEYNTNEEDNTEQRRKVVKILPHPTYNATINKHHNDIALLELDRPLSFNSYVTPICIGSREFTNALLKHGTGTVSGWGSTLFRGRPATILQILKVPFVDRPTCLKSTSTTILQNMFCAGFPTGGSDTCGGDSGGPYTTEIEGTWFLTGITSWGEECAKPGKYGIYTRVSKYLKWIKEITRLT